MNQSLKVSWNYALKNNKLGKCPNLEVHLNGGAQLRAFLFTINIFWTTENTPN